MRIKYMKILINKTFYKSEFRLKFIIFFKKITVYFKNHQNFNNNNNISLDFMELLSTKIL